MSRSAISTCFLNPSRDGDSTTSLGSLGQCLTTLSVKKIFPPIQSKPPLAQLEAISSRPIAGYLGEETNTHLTTTSFQVDVESKGRESRREDASRCGAVHGAEWPQAPGFTGRLWELCVQFQCWREQRRWTESGENPPGVVCRGRNQGGYVKLF